MGTETETESASFRTSWGNRRVKFSCPVTKEQYRTNDLCFVTNKLAQREGSYFVPSIKPRCSLKTSVFTHKLNVISERSRRINLYSNKVLNIQ